MQPSFDNDNPNCSFAGFLIQTGWQLTDFQRELCLCDQHAAECFKRNEYNPRYSKHDKKKCLSPIDLNKIEDEEELVYYILMKNGLK